jgi:hypothetical protein
MAIIVSATYRFYAYSESEFQTPFENDLLDLLNVYATTMRFGLSREMLFGAKGNHSFGFDPAL